jgi:hypothetical protein
VPSAWLCRNRLSSKNSAMSALSHITAVESKRLVELEEQIEKGIKTFITVGEALAEIRDSQLYRVSYESFEAYCLEEWDMSRPRVYQLIGAAIVAKTVSTTVDIPAPTSERQARPLTKLATPAQQREAWQEAQEIAGDAPVTAKHVEVAVERVQSGEPKAERIHFKPSNGMQYAELAISNLKKIQPNDTERKAAFNKVLKFIQSSL